MQKWEKIAVVENKDLWLNDLEKVGVNYVSIRISTALDLICTHKTHIKLTIQHTVDDIKLVPGKDNLFWICESIKKVRSESFLKKNKGDGSD